MMAKVIHVPMQVRIYLGPVLLFKKNVHTKVLKLYLIRAIEHVNAMWQCISMHV